MQGDLWFTYHHYGPFCRDMTEALDWEIALGRVDEVRKPAGSGSSYSIFSRKPGIEVDESAVGNLPMDEARRLVALMHPEPSIVLELAATIHWLRHAEKVPDWHTELKRRKTVKASDANVARAESILEALDLAA